MVPAHLPVLAPEVPYASRGHGSDGRTTAGYAGRVVDVACQVGQARYDLGMLEDSHSALVAWLESAAPTQPRLF